MKKVGWWWGWWWWRWWKLFEGSNEGGAGVGYGGGDVCGDGGDEVVLYLAQLGWQRSTCLYTYRSIPNWLPTSTLDRVLNYLKPFTESFFELNFDCIISVYEN